MKKMVVVFIWGVLLALTVVPAINFYLGNLPKKAGDKWWSTSVLYNLDFALPCLGRFFYPLGISIKPNQVIIGKDGWLYLGDQYDKTLSVARRGTTLADIESARKIGLATQAWEQWSKLKGTSLYRVMLAPNKSTIYPEFLPDWAQPAADSVTDTLLANVSRDIYVDTRTALIAAKPQFLESLYYKTDTHWNELGAWVAFRAFAIEIARTDASLRWLSDQQIRVLSIKKRHRGDLARFLWMAETLRDSDVRIKIAIDTPIVTEAYNLETEHHTESDVNPAKLLLVKSKHALNQKRVLWIHDSFGDAILPYMAATFTETLHTHYAFITDPARLAQLIGTYQPDFVFITVVERYAGGRWFEMFPPT